MGVYKNSSIGVRRKSVGENTYKSVRGRIIVSSKITENNSKSPEQIKQRSAFGIMGQSAKIMATWIDQAFSKTKYGSQRNNFMKQNASVMLWLKENKAKLKGNSLGMLSEAIASGVPVLSGFGPNFVNVEFEQTGAELALSATFSKDFVVGDIVKIAIMQTYSKENPTDSDVLVTNHFNSIKVYEYTIVEADLGNNLVTIDKAKIKELESAAKPPVGFVSQSIIAAVIVLSNKETCQSYFTPLALFKEPEDDRPVIE